MKVKIVNWNNGREVWLAVGDGIHRRPLFSTAAAKLRGRLAPGCTWQSGLWLAATVSWNWRVTAVRRLLQSNACVLLRALLRALRPLHVAVGP